MSFREVKSMLRMINIDMDDVYAYKLFKVPILCSITVILHFCHYEGMLAPSLPSHAQRTVKFITPKATHHHQWLGPPPVVGSHHEEEHIMRWGELSPLLLCGSLSCDVFPPWDAVPMGIFQGPFPPGEIEARHSALLHPRLEGQRAMGWRTEGTFPHIPLGTTHP